MKARADLVNKAIDDLGISAIGQAVDAETYEAVDGVVDSIVEALAAREIVYLPDLSQIPEAVFLDAAILVANACQSNFGLEQDERDALRAEAVAAEGRLREIYRGRPTYEHQRAVYY